MQQRRPPTLPSGTRSSGPGLAAGLLAVLLWACGPAPEAPAEAPEAAAVEEPEVSVSQRRAKRPFMVQPLDLFGKELAARPESVAPPLQPLLGDLVGPDYGAVSEWLSVLHYVLRTSPDDPHAQLMLAHAWLLMGNESQALRELSLAPELPETAEWRSLLASTALVEDDRAAEALEVLAAGPQSPLVVFEEARVQSKLGQAAAALEAAHRACSAGVREACISAAAVEQRRDRRAERRATRGKAKGKRGGGLAPGSLKQQGIRRPSGSPAPSGG